MALENENVNDLKKTQQESDKLLLHSDDVFTNSIQIEKREIDELPEEIQKNLDSIPDVRMDKVDEFKNKIEAGKYIVTEEMQVEIAEALTEAEENEAPLISAVIS